METKIQEAKITEEDIIKVIAEFGYALMRSAVKVNKWGITDRIARTPLKLQAADCILDQTLKIVFNAKTGGGGYVGLTLGKDLHYTTVDELRTHIKTLLVQHAKYCIQTDEDAKALPEEWRALMSKSSV